MRSLAALWVAALLLCLMSGCSQDATELVIVVDTDFAIPGEIDRVEISVTGPSGRVVLAGASVVSSESLPMSLGAVPEEGAAPGRLHQNSRDSQRKHVFEVLDVSSRLGSLRGDPSDPLPSSAGVVST